jgi:hypothetical protein
VRHSEPRYRATSLGRPRLSSESAAQAWGCSTSNQRVTVDAVPASGSSRERLVVEQRGLRPLK